MNGKNLYGTVTVFLILATSSAVAGPDELPQLCRTKVTSCAVSSSDRRQPKPGMPKLDGAVSVDGNVLPTSTNLISVDGFAARTVALPAIDGNALALPAPLLR